MDYYENKQQYWNKNKNAHWESKSYINTRKNERTYFYIKKSEEKKITLEEIENLLEDDMHEDQDEILNSLIEEYLLKQDIQDSIIEEQALEAERFNSLVEERIQEYADLYDAIEGFEEDDCDYGPDYDDYPYENEIGVDLALYSPQFEYDESEDSSCCFEIGYYNDENSSGIFGGYVDMYHPEFVPSFRHIYNFLIFLIF